MPIKYQKTYIYCFYLRGRKEKYCELVSNLFVFKLFNFEKRIKMIRKYFPGVWSAEDQLMLLAMIYQRWDNVMETGILSDYFPWAVDTRQSVQERNLCEKCPRYPALQKIRTIHIFLENIKFNGINLGA